MANFNEKVLCLFHKDYKQLKKEMGRRGMVYETREKAIAKSIWKDAYDAGIIEGKDIAARERGMVVRNCSANCSGNVVPKAYCLHEIENDRKYRLELTDEQVRMFEWLQEMEWLSEMELSEWDDSFEDIGRI